MYYIKDGSRSDDCISNARGDKSAMRPFYKLLWTSAYLKKRQSSIQILKIRTRNTFDENSNEVVLFFLSEFVNLNNRNSLSSFSSTYCCLTPR